MTRILSLACVLFFLGVSTIFASVPPYPETRTGDIVDDYFGTQVADPYRWLEKSADPEVESWVNAQNQVTQGYLSGIAGRDVLEERLRELMDYERFSLPILREHTLFYTYNSGLQNQSIWYQRDRATGEALVLLDPNGLREDGTGAVRGVSFSGDGRYMAYGISWSGSDWTELHIKDVHTGKDLPEVIHHVKFSRAAWLSDGSGFFYSRQPTPGTVPEGDEHYYMKVHFHRLGSDPQDDPVIFERPEAKEHGFGPMVTDDGRFLLVSVWGGSASNNEVFWGRLEGDPTQVKLQGLMTGFDAAYGFVGSINDVLYFTTNLDAPQGRLIAVDFHKSSRENWKTVIPEGRGKLDDVSMAPDRFFAVRLQNAHELLSVHGLDGAKIAEVALPSLGNVSVSTHPRYRTAYVSFSSYLQPSVIYQYDFETHQLNPYISPELKFSPEHFTSRQIWYESKDGTKVPMFLVHKRGLTLDGSNPTLLYGYGGFDISMKPYYSATRLLWVEQGGVLAVANLRGGGEFGKEWHQAGMLERKQNVFDDFISAAEYLIEHGYTTTRRLAIQGGSNGGLLTAACMIQRPDLFGVVLTQVPVADMLRYHLFTVARYWIPEYGSSEDPEQFKFLKAYSPLHNIQEGTRYPSTLVTTADTDDRVHPGQAKKYAATLQKANASDNPILLRVATRAGHGAGKPTEKRIKEAVDIYGFVLYEMGVLSKKVTAP